MGNVGEIAEAPKVPKKKFKLRMPGAFAMLFILTIFAVIATWTIPAGAYSKMVYSSSSSDLKITSSTGQTSHVPATQKELDKLGVKIDIKQFTSGGITDAVSVPNTYQRLKQKPAHISAITESMVNGVIETVDIMVFIFVLGGLIGVVTASGGFE